MSVVVVGSVNMDVVARVASIPRPGETVLARDSARGGGGKGANQAVAAARAGGARVAFVGHSLGCRVAMRAAQRLVRGVRVEKPTLDRLCLMAAAIDSDSLSKDESTSYRDVAEKADRIAVLASQEDRVLQVAYRMGDSVQSWWPFSGERSVRALGRYGPEGGPPEVLAKVETWMADANQSIGHSTYLPEYPSSSPPKMKTEAESEQFVFEFLNRRPNPAWPKGRLRP